MTTHRLLVGIDDTDQLEWDVGTGKFGRRLAAELAEQFPLDPQGVVRQQLLVDDRVPYTTHNSAACLRFDVTDQNCRTDVIEAAAEALRTRCAPNADPGLCVAYESAVTDEIVEWGERATAEVLTDDAAFDLASTAEVHLDEYGGSGMGVVGALAAVGSTAAGTDGRFVAFHGVREFEDTVSVETLRDRGVRVVGPDGDALTEGLIRTEGWLRPELRNGEATLPVERADGHYLPANLSERGGH